MVSLMMAVTVSGVLVVMVARQVTWCMPWLYKISMPNAW